MLYIATTLFLASSLQDSLWAHSPFSAIWEIPGCSISLLVYHIYCDISNIPEASCCSTSPLLPTAFISSCVGSYSRSALSNFIAGVHAWHILHGQPWPLNEDQVKSTLTGAARLVPPSFSIAASPLMQQ